MKTASLNTSLLACALLCLCGGAFAQSSAGAAPVRQPKTLAELADSIKPAISTASVAFSIVDLRNPDLPLRTGFSESLPIYPASLIKLPIMIAAYAAAQAEPALLDRAVTIELRNDTGTWYPADDGIADPDPAIHVGEKWTVRDMLRVMITRSDNIAANTLIDVLGRSRINATLARLGYAQTRVYRKVYSANPLDDPEEAALADKTNILPPAEAANMLCGILSGTLVSREASASMFGLLRRQLDRELIAAALPKETTYAGKTGESALVLDDAAIITGPGRRYVLVIYATHPARAARVRDIHKVAAAVDAYFSAK